MKFVDSRLTRARDWELAQTKRIFNVIFKSFCPLTVTVVSTLEGSTAAIIMLSLKGITIILQQMHNEMAALT